MSKCRVCDDTGVILYADRGQGVIKLDRAHACDCYAGRMKQEPSRDKKGEEPNPRSAVRSFRELAVGGWSAVPQRAGALACMRAKCAERGIDPDAALAWAQPKRPQADYSTENLEHIGHTL
jgi:hypothetical protein